MLLAAVSSLQLIWINIGFALLMLSAGFTIGWWIFGGDAGESDQEADADRANARAALARVRELASSVASEVGAHTSRVQEITTDLQDSTTAGGAMDGVVLATVAEVLKANEQLTSQLASAEQKLQQQAEEIEIHAADARTDPLTQLNNRRRFDAELERRYTEWKRLQTPYSVFLIDVDHFKEFNDLHGHLAGDEVLRGVARVLQGAMREMDVVCRYGGEEFAVIMPATVGEPARRGAERARTAIEEASFRFEGIKLQVTASVGLAEVAVGEDNEDLIRRADEALYASKNAGRNNAHLHDGAQPAPILLAPIPVAAAPPESPAKPPAERAALRDRATRQPMRQTFGKLPDGAVFTAELRRRVSEAQHFQTPLSALLIHVDDLSRFNNQYGDEIGGALLDTVAHYLDDLLRDVDLLTRYSDGRFAAMLSDSGAEATVEVARRLRRAVADFELPTKTSPVRLTVSMGLSELTTGEAPEDLRSRTERALAAAIANGPDATFVHDGHGCRRVLYEGHAPQEARA